ncbi:MAG: hypothetical protein ACT4P4_13985 [Betaproteobacteria bacterium]
MLRHNLFDGVTYRTFTASQPMVMGASLRHPHHRDRGRAGKLRRHPRAHRRAQRRPVLRHRHANEIIAQTERALASAANHRYSIPGGFRI